jgi:hypothetical protein
MPISASRILLTFLLVIPISVYFWDDLVEQMGESKFKALLIVSFAIACGITDVNELVGQPEEGHDD